MTSVLAYSPMTDPFASHAHAHAEAKAQAQAQAHAHRLAQSTPPLAVVNARRVTPTSTPAPDEFGHRRVSMGHGQGYTPPQPVASTSATTAHAYGSNSIPSSSKITPPAASRKRASHQPGAAPQRSPPKPEHLTDEYVLHPSVHAYRMEHPNRQMVGFGPYVLLQTLGEGEFGKVKLGVHTDYGVEVAIKLIRRGTLDNEESASKVEREIDVLKTLKHPNIVRMFDVIDTEKYIGIVIEFAAGGELFDYILANRHLRERDAQKLFAQLISGVDYLHKKHIVHRDLKLENLLLDKHRNIIITDFGFANPFNDRDRDLMSTSCGSPCYAAPELVVSDGEYVGSAVDIWSCGIILFAMLAGYLPYDDDPDNPDGDNLNLLYKYICSTTLTFPPQVPLGAHDLLQIMLVPDPRYRATMEEVQQHPWLSAHRALFERTVEMNEWIFQDQMYKKSQAAKRELNERKKVQREAHMAKYKVQRSQSSMPGSSVDQRARKHKSAMPGSATAGDLRSTPLQPLPEPVQEPLAPALTPSSTMAVENEGASTASLPLATVEKPVNTNRHTIQLEYDGGGYEAEEHTREVSDESRVELPITVTSDVEASSVGHGTEVEEVEETRPVTPPPAPAPADDPTTPKASMQVDAHATPRAITPKGHKFDTLPVRSPTVPGPKAQRTRKGMSLDKFGLAKLLGNDAPKTDAPPTASMRALQASTAVNAPKERRSMMPESKRKTLTIIRSNSVRGKAPAPLSARDLNPSSAPPHITTTDTSKPADKTASTSAAKKVMDWFRRKSVAKDNSVRTTQRNDSDASFVRVAASDTSSVAREETALAPVQKAPAVQETPTAPVAPVARVPVESSTSLAPATAERALAPSPLPEPTRQPLADTDGTNVASPPRGTPTRSKSHGVDSQLATAASSEDYKLRIHTGVLDQSALSSKPPQDVMAEAVRVLMDMGIEVKRENEYRLRCTRAKRRGRGFGSVISMAGKRESRPPIPNSPSASSILSPGGIRGMLRRGSTTPGQIARSESMLASPPSSVGTAYSPALPSVQVEPIYGEHSVDSGDEIRFNVELCRIKNLPGLYLLNIKRLRGSVWSFKFIYQTVIERCDTLTH